MWGKDEIAIQVDHAHGVARILRFLGWVVTGLGLMGIVVFGGLFVAGDLSVEQLISLVLGTMLATVLSGASAYGAGVGIDLAAERLRIAAVPLDRRDPGA